MIRNYIKIALRNLVKNKVYSFINIAGLSIGLSVCLLITLFVIDELSYDSFHKKADRIMLFQQSETGATSGSGFADLLKNGVTQVDKTVRLVKTKPLLSLPNQSYYESEFYFVDSTFFQIFDFELASGDVKTALTLPNSLVISEKMAQKYFPNQDPIGKFLKYEDKQNLQVSGVLKTIPENSHLNIDFLCNFKNASELLGQKLDGFWDGMSLTYVLLTKGTDKQTIIKKLPQIASKTNDPNASIWKLNFVPLREIYLKNKLIGGIKSQNAIENVYIFSAIAILILILACFNYINLASARSSLRSKEVGVRKVLGANYQQLFLQFLGESTLFTFIALSFSIVFTQIFLPFFNDFTDKNLSLNTLLSPEKLVTLLGTFVLISLLTGGYPALVLSRFKPITVLKNAFFKPSSGFSFRQMLVVLQFSVSVIMIIATVVIMNQLYFIRHKDLGYNREQILTVDFQGNTPTNLKNTFKEQVQSLSSVKSATQLALLPGQGTFSNKLVETYVPKGKDIAYKFIYGDGNFLETFGIKLLQGRTFDTNSTSQKNEFLINRAMLKYLEWGKNGVGKKLAYTSYQYSPDGTYKEIPVEGDVIGVIEDYHQTDLKSLIQPMVILLNPDWGGSYIAIKIQAGQSQNVIEASEKLWKDLFPNKPFEYSFLDENFDKTYKKETKTSEIFALFASLAVFISCLGLFGLVAFTAERRTKEIGIRKVMGASISSLVALLSKDFLKLVLISNIIAFPIAYFFMKKWLQDFAYKADISWWVFIISGILAIIIALLTVSYQAIRAALMNPVKSLKSE